MKIKRIPRAVKAQGSGSIFGFFGGGRDKFQQVADLTFQDGAKSGEDVGIEASDLIFVVPVQLSGLHFRALSQLRSADFLFFKQFCQVDFYSAVLIQVLTPLHRNW